MRHHDDDDDGAWDDSESEDYPGSDSDDEVETLPCPNCGAAVYDESPQCPSCGDYITYSTSALSDKPRWYIVLGVLGVAAVILIMLVAICG